MTPVIYVYTRTFTDCSGETVKFASDDLTFTVGVLVAGAVAVIIVLVVLVFMIAALCQICVSERRELQKIRAETREMKKKKLLHREIKQSAHVREGRVRV